MTSPLFQWKLVSHCDCITCHSVLWLHVHTLHVSVSSCDPIAVSLMTTEPTSLLVIPAPTPTTFPLTTGLPHTIPIAESTTNTFIQLSTVEPSIYSTVFQNDLPHISVEISELLHVVAWHAISVLCTNACDYMPIECSYMVFLPSEYLSLLYWAWIIT